MATATTSNLKAKVYAVCVEIMCPNSDGLGCDSDSPIPAPDGSFMWDRIPETVTCPRCRHTFKTSSKIYRD